MNEKKIKKVAVSGIKYELRLGIVVPINIRSNYYGVYGFFSNFLKKKFSEMKTEIFPIKFTLDPIEKYSQQKEYTKIEALQFYLVEDIDKAISSLKNEHLSINIEDVILDKEDKMNFYMILQSTMSGAKYLKEVYIDKTVADKKAKDMEGEFVNYVVHKKEGEKLGKDRCIIDDVVYKLNTQTIN